jgi:hypothetical protein
MTSRGRQFAKHLRKGIRGDRAHLFRRHIPQLFCSKRGARDRRGTPPAKKPHVGDATIFESRKKFKDVAADRIRHLDNRIGVRQLSGVSRIAEVLENGVAEHVLFGEAYFFGGRYFFSTEATTT